MIDNERVGQAAIATVFLDRDGVINRRLIGDYVTCLEELDILDGAITAICRLNQAGFRTVVVTNQRGIAIGRMTREAVDKVHLHLSEQISSAGGCLEEFYVCPHQRNTGCGCRKPDPGLLDQANRTRPVAWDRSYLIGDSDTDIEAGQKRGVTTIKVAGSGNSQPDQECVDLPAAVAWILEEQAGRP